MPNPEDAPAAEINLDRVVEILVNDYHLENAYVEQTGGGVAAIYAGPLVSHPGEPDRRYAAVAGPGSYGWGHRASVADWADFYIGCDDQGETDPVCPGDLGARTEEDIAKLIHAQAQNVEPVRPLSHLQIERLGFDGRAMTASPETAHTRAEVAAYVEASNASNRELAAKGVPGYERLPLNEAAGMAAIEALRARENQ